MFRQHEKFWAFIILVFAIMGLAALSVFIGLPITGHLSEAGMEANQLVLNTKLRIVDAALVGLVGIAGVAAQALFRTSETAGQMNEILKSTIEGLKQSRPANDTPPSPTQPTPPTQTTPPTSNEQPVDPWNEPKSE